MALNTKIHREDPSTWLKTIYEIIDESETRFLDLDECDAKEADLQQADFDDAKSAMAYIAEEFDIDLKDL